jgi:hypothetical protein
MFRPLQCKAVDTFDHDLCMLSKLKLWKLFSCRCLRCLVKTCDHALQMLSKLFVCMTKSGKVTQMLKAMLFGESLWTRDQDVVLAQLLHDNYRARYSNVQSYADFWKDVVMKCECRLSLACAWQVPGKLLECSNLHRLVETSDYGLKMLS